MRIFLSVGWEISKTTFEGVTKTPRAAPETPLAVGKRGRHCQLSALSFMSLCWDLFVAF